MRKVSQRLSPYSTSPQKGQDPDIFDKYMDARVTEQERHTIEFNTAADQVNDAIDDINQAATTAENAAAAAQWSGSYAGDWSDLTGGLDGGKSVHHNAVLWMALKDITEVTLSEPKHANPDWLCLSNDPIMWDTNRPFETGETMVFSDGYKYVALEDTAAGESPVTYPAKWKSQHPSLYDIKEHGAVTSNITINPHEGHVHKVTVNADITISFSGFTAGVYEPVKLMLTASGSRDILWDPAVQWPWGGRKPAMEPDSLNILIFGTMDGGASIQGGYAGGGYA